MLFLVKIIVGVLTFFASLAFALVFSVILSSIMSIFLPTKLGYTAEHLEKCWLKHNGFVNKFWHALDTRFFLLTFSSGHRVLKRSPNRLEFLKREKLFREKLITETRP